jgi:GT2 family glycosyltransferase
MENGSSPLTTSNKILIILLNWNGKKDTLECLESLKKVTYPDFTTIVIDNGSSDDSVSSIRALFPHIPLFETKENLGFAGGNNVGIAWGLKKNYDWILLLNNDTTVDPNFLDAFMESARENPKAKILGAKIYRSFDPKRIDHLGGRWNPKIAEFESLVFGCIDDGTSFETMQKVDYVCGAALLMHRSVPETIGLLEPRYFLFWEETDFCCRARRLDFEVWTSPQAKIWHKVSSSFTGGKPQMHYFWWRSRLLWIERNCPFSEKNHLYRTVIIPDLWKMMRHYLLRSLQNKLFFRKSNTDSVQKARRNKAGLVGALHYFLGKWGYSPSWI